MGRSRLASARGPHRPGTGQLSHLPDIVTLDGEAKRKLTKGGLIVADDVSWNASLWDFADSFGVPSYNFKGSIGVAFF